MKLTIPELCLVVLMGPSGAGKSTFARKHFLPTEIVSSDECRGIVSDNPNSLEATNDAFEVLNYIAGKRLARGRLTVIDATNVQPEARAPLLKLAREHDVLCVAVVLKLPEEVCRERNKSRADRDFGSHVIRNQCLQLRRSIRGLRREGFRYQYVLSSQEEIESVIFERQPLWTDRKSDHGPFDIIGDVHGCYAELVELLSALGYVVRADGQEIHVTPPNGRKAIFLGDLVDRGPRSPEVLRLVMGMVKAGTALCVPGNHDVKLLNKLQGRDVKVAHGMAETLEQLGREPVGFARDAGDFIDSLVSHYVLDDGRLVVAHAGMKQQYIGRASGRVRSFALFGDTTGETDDAGLPVRLDWAADYRGDAAIVYGHTPVDQPRWHNNTINIDTGCVFGGQLTALRWPEKQLVSVQSHQTWARPGRPFLPLPAMGEHREFGIREPDETYHPRPGSYAVISDDQNRVAVMKLGSFCFLPGGGAEPDESPTQTLARELREECARAARVIRRLGEATQLISRPDRCIAKRGIYFEAVFTDTLEGAVEADHQLLWLSPAEAIEQLKHEAQKWAVQAWMLARQKPQTLQKNDDVLDINDVLGKRIIQTRLGPTVTVPQENSAAALEVMSRFAVDPRWLIYLPPTMSPGQTSREPGLLEHPDGAFDYFRQNGCPLVICQEKHMGSRAVAIVCKDNAAARARFGIEEESIGIVYTRTGRRFFEDRETESQVLDLLRRSIDAAGLWRELQTDWLCLDCELMPWSAKAQDLLKQQYAAVGAASRAVLTESAQVIHRAAESSPDSPAVAELAKEIDERLELAGQFVQAYRRYCWPVTSVNDLRLAPFHILAGENHVYLDRDHLWHMQTLARLADAHGPVLMATAHRQVELNDSASVAAAVAWWEELTSRGGEGMVVKPMSFIARGPRGLMQPAVKCRGKEYLRLIYGPHYTLPENLNRLRERGLAAKRSLAMREFALGVESLERFVARDPLHRVHECVFGVLALESEPVDPRL